jgi:hypothetical protein
MLPKHASVVPKPPSPGVAYLIYPHPPNGVFLSYLRSLLTYTPHLAPMDVPTLSFALTILLLHPQVYFGIRYRTWLYFFLTASGMTFQVVVYLARVQKDLSVEREATIMAPAFLGAAIHYSLFRVAETGGWDELKGYGNRVMVIDSMVLGVQGISGLLACHGIVTRSISRAGLAWWLASTLIIVGLASKTALAMKRERNRKDSWESEKLDWLFGGESLVLWL